MRFSSTLAAGYDHPGLLNLIIPTILDEEYKL
jgi:hypothetical protein